MDALRSEDFASRLTGGIEFLIRFPECGVTGGCEVDTMTENTSEGGANMNDALPWRNHRRWSLRAKVLVVLGVLLCAWSIFQLWPVWLEPGPTTTVITDPLRPDGTIDYAAALNREYSAGVTPENNAAVLLLQALGPGVIGPPLRGAYFQELGIDPLPLEGNYLRPIDQFYAQDPQASTRMQDDLDQALKRPLDQDEFPELAQWLAANEQALELCKEACQRERNFDPLVVPLGEPLLSNLCPLVQSTRNISRLLSLRAMSHLRSGDIDEALSDAQSIHRLSRLIGQHPQMISQYVACAHEAMACQAESSIFSNAQLSAPQARYQRKFLEGLPPLPAMSDLIDHGERFQMLDAMQAQFLSSTFSVGWMHPNAFLELFNAGYDNLSAAMREPELSAQLSAISGVKIQFENQQKIRWKTVGGMLLHPRRNIPTQTASIMLALMAPSAERAVVAEHRTRVHLQLAITGFALAEYRALNGDYPATLDDLVPEFIPQVPQDPFAEGTIRYVAVPEKNSVLIYSVGENGVDDHGMNDFNRKADDLTFGAAPEH